MITEGGYITQRDVRNQNGMCDRKATHGVDSRVHTFSLAPSTTTYLEFFGSVTITNWQPQWCRMRNSQILVVW